MEPYLPLNNLTDDQKKEVAILINAGAPTEKIAERYNTGLSIVTLISTQRAFWIHPGRVTRDPDQQFRYAQYAYRSESKNVAEAIDDLVLRGVADDTAYRTGYSVDVVFAGYLLRRHPEEILPFPRKDELTYFAWNFLKSQINKERYLNREKAIASTAPDVEDHSYTLLSTLDLDKRETVKKIVNVLLDTLSVRDREVIKLRHGLNDPYRYSVDEVARIFKTSPRRIITAEKEALDNLRTAENMAELERTVDSLD